MYRRKGDVYHLNCYHINTLHLSNGDYERTKPSRPGREYAMYGPHPEVRNVCMRVRKRREGK
jgi:hypothetical protein